MNVSVEGYMRKEETEEKVRLERERGKSYSLQLFSSRLSPSRVHLKEKIKTKQKKKGITKMQFGLKSKPKT